MEIPELDILWVLVATGLVFLMQAGFLFLETGLTRAKNYINVAVKNIVDFGIAFVMFWVIGFAIMFGLDNGGGLYGTSNLFVSFKNGDPWLITFFLYQSVFAGTTVTILSGAVAERVKFSSYIIIAIICSLIYPIFGHWAWGGAYAGESGWLAAKGFVDFAGSTVVHSFAGWVALAAIMIIGPRIGRFAPDGTPRNVTPSNIPLAMFGTLVLWFGWIGFNGGSTLAFDGSVPGIIANTMLAASAGLLISFVAGWIKSGYPAPTAPLNGALAGLVAITANAHAVSAPSAFFIGAVAALVMMAAERLLEKNRLDDAVGAIPVHLAAGIWGTLAVALFADLEVLGTGLGRGEQIGVQLMGIGAACGMAFVLPYVAFRIINSFFRFRVDPDDEVTGLNVAEHKATTELIDLLNTMEHQTRTGDLSSTVEVEPFTEVGQVAERYNMVVSYMQEMSGIANDIASGNLDIEVKPRSERDTFGNSFARMVTGLREMIGQVASISTQLSKASEQLSSTSEQADAFTTGVAQASHLVAKAAEEPLRARWQSISSRQPTAPNKPTPPPVREWI